MIDEHQFRQDIAAALKDVARQVDALDTDDIDWRLADGVLQVEFASGGVFVLSQQVPVRELWLSALSRAWHFVRAEGGWTERDHHVPLEQVLGEIFAKKMGRPCAFANPG